MFSFARIRAALLVAVPAVTLSAQTTSAPSKIAYIDSRYIVSNAPATPAAQAVLQKESAAAEAEVGKMSQALDALTTAFTKDQATLSGEKRDARIKAINDKQAESQQRYDALRGQLQDREAELMQPILDQIKIALEDVRVELGLTMILDISQNGVLVAADKNLNVSDRVLAKLRTMPVPAIADKSAASKADPAKGGAKAPSGGPVQGPAGIGGKGLPAPGKKADSTTKKPDSLATKKPDSVATKKP